MRHFSEIEMRNDNNTRWRFRLHFRIMEDVMKNMLNHLQAGRYTNRAFSFLFLSFAIPTHTRKLRSRMDLNSCRDFSFFELLFALNNL